jgi:putative oxidoreductase
MLDAIVSCHSRLNRLGSRLPVWTVALPVRLAVFTVFWRSVQTKITGWDVLGQHLKFWAVTDSTFTLFQYEYTLPVLPPELAAYLATFVEFFLSLAILFGVFTRIGALGLLLMTGVIQVFVYPDAWNVHLLWAALLLYLIRYGPGALSVDHVVFGRRP